MVINDKEKSMKRLGYALIAVGLVLAATTNAIAGSPVQAPEINPTSVSAGLALLAGGVMLVRMRRRK